MTKVNTWKEKSLPVWTPTPCILCQAGSTPWRVIGRDPWPPWYFGLDIVTGGKPRMPGPHPSLPSSPLLPRDPIHSVQPCVWAGCSSVPWTAPLPCGRPCALGASRGHSARALLPVLLLGLPSCAFSKGQPSVAPTQAHDPHRALAATRHPAAWRAPSFLLP